MPGREKVHPCSKAAARTLSSDEGDIGSGAA